MCEHPYFRSCILILDIHLKPKLKCEQLKIIKAAALHNLLGK